MPQGEGGGGWHLKENHENIKSTPNSEILENMKEKMVFKKSFQ